MDNFVADGIFIDASPERVFAALHEPEEVLEWLDAQEARIAPGINGEYSVLRVDGTRITGEISEFEPGKRLVVESVQVENDGTTRHPMKISFQLDPVDYGVWITVRQDDLDCAPNWEDYADETRRLWVHATVTLKRLIEQI